MALENEGDGGELQASGEGGTAATPNETFDRPALEGKVAEGLAGLFGDDAADHTKPEAAADETEVESEEAAQAEDEVSEEGEEETDVEDTSDNEEQEEEAAAATPPVKPAGNAPTLPDAYRRSLKAYGWEDADIDANLKTLGGSFIVTAQKIHANRNAETARQAAEGRAERERQRKATEGQKPQNFEQMQPIDAKALKDHFGDDKLIDAIINPVNAAIERINAMVPAIQQTQQKSQVAELETLGRQVEGFFGGKELQPFAEVYGNATKELTEQQIVARNKVLETADALVCGAQLQGRSMSLGEALSLAHDSVSGSYKLTAARKELKAALVKRQAGISLKPGNKGKAPASGGPPAKTRGDLEKKVAKGLSGIFT